MANSFFQFKEFRVDQGKCAMKVTTEACILGAWVAAQSIEPLSVLDVGCGTGLLTLMLAQRFSKASFTAVECEPDAVLQCAENFRQTHWKSRITLTPGRIQEVPLANHDLVICNPPFFHQSLKSPKSKINQARHTEALSPEDLAKALARVLPCQGVAYVLYPPDLLKHLQVCLDAANLYLTPCLQLVQSPRHGVFRTILKIRSVPLKQGEAEMLCIRDKNGDYTRDFVDLLKPYYLHL